MGDFIENLESLLKALGIEHYYAEMILIYCTAWFGTYKLFYFIRKELRALSYRNFITQICDDLSPNYTKFDITNSSRFFIRNRFQNVSPSEDDEPNSEYSATASQDMEDFFILNLFSKPRQQNNLHLILAESGMGKTTSLIHIYIKYKYKIKQANSGEDIYLFPLASNDTNTNIDKIENKSRSIILLDALDEDPKAQIDYEHRLNEIVERCKEFRYVIISCRTQFFPSGNEEAHKAGYLTYGNQNNVKFQKLYLSPFNENDINKFLNKRFPLVVLHRPFILVKNFKNRKNAKRLVLTIPKLSMRPLALTFIESVVSSGRNIAHAFQLYENFIEFWIQRESNKPQVQVKYGHSRETFMTLLYDFSSNIAVDLFNRRHENPSLTLTEQDFLYQRNANLISVISDGLKLDISRHERRVQSLLNRNSAGGFKFAHKSMLEFFVAKHFWNHPTGFLDINLQGYDQVKTFVSELLIVNFGNLNQLHIVIQNAQKPSRRTSHRRHDYYVLQSSIKTPRYLKDDQLELLIGAHIIPTYSQPMGMQYSIGVISLDIVTYSLLVESCVKSQIPVHYLAYNQSDFLPINQAPHPLYSDFPKSQERVGINLNEDEELDGFKIFDRLFSLTRRLKELNKDITFLTPATNKTYFEAYKVLEEMELTKDDLEIVQTEYGAMMVYGRVNPTLLNSYSGLIRFLDYLIMVCESGKMMHPFSIEIRGTNYFAEITDD